jgi:hypothetical protein
VKDIPAGGEGCNALAKICDCFKVDFFGKSTNRDRRRRLPKLLRGLTLPATNYVWGFGKIEPGSLDNAFAEG